MEYHDRPFSLNSFTHKHHLAVLLLFLLLFTPFEHFTKAASPAVIHAETIEL